jgi:hypothetical protein
MPTGLRVVDVFHVAGRTIIAADVTDGALANGDRLGAGDGTEIKVVSVAFSSVEAWARGRRGIQIEVLGGEVSVGQTFVPLPRD